MYWRTAAPTPSIEPDSSNADANSFDTGSFSKISASNISAISPSLNCGASDASSPIFDDLILRLEDNLALEEDSLSLATYERKGNMNWDKFQEAVRAFAERRQKKRVASHPSSERSAPQSDGGENNIDDDDDADSISSLCCQLVEEIESRNQSGLQFGATEDNDERNQDDKEEESSSLRTAQSTTQH